jgi:serine/threonine protein kinase
MNWIGNIIDDRYKVDNIFSLHRGMSELFFVSDLHNKFNEQIVLKICTHDDDEYVKRFRREIRLLNTFQGNSKVVQVLDSNPDYMIDTLKPYFVMKHYPRGDLTKLIPDLINNYKLQEKVFNQMIFCISELHTKNIFHRDIKPQNFLIDEQHIVVSDFGLGVEPNSLSHLTNTSMYGGSDGYMPPEFYHGGFKNADAQSDIFMLGKSFYTLIANRHPAFLSSDNISPPIYHVIARCCNQHKEYRYQDLAELQQNLKSAFDVILNRGGAIGKINQLSININIKLSNGEYDSSEIIEFIRNLSLLDRDDKIRVIYELHDDIFAVITQNPVSDVLLQFMESYSVMVISCVYEWSYAEKIARNMNVIFSKDYIATEIRVMALDLAIRAASLMSRFAAMDTCKSMIMNIDSDELGLAIYPIIQNNVNTFVSDIEPSNCRSDAVRQALIAIKPKENF